MNGTGFSPTHLVPEDGLPAWDVPDPSRAPVATIPGRLDVQLAERSGDWARVICSNGWAGWVDGRRLVDLSPTPPPPPPPAPLPQPSPPPSLTSPGWPAPVVAQSRSAIVWLALIGGALAVVSALLPWLRGIGSATAFKVPIKFLVAPTSGGTGGPNIGLALIALGGLGIAASALPAMPNAATFRRICGGAIVVVATAYAGQIMRSLNALNRFGGSPSFVKTLGFGVYVALAGGVMLSAGKSRGG